MLGSGPAADLPELIDVRQPWEYAQDHIPGARHVPVGELGSRLDELDPDKMPVFYCGAGGGRSRTAAAVAADSGRFPAGVAQLKGGIQAWQGKTPPHRPPLKAFESVETYRDALMAALELEKGSWMFYEGLLKDPPKQFACSTIQELAEAKQHHARSVYGFLEKFHRDANKPLPPFEELFGSLKGNILESGHNVAELLAWARAAYEDCGALAELALDLEYEAYDLYRNMAFDADDPAEERVFTTLSGHEKDLVQLLADQIDKLKEPERPDTCPPCRSS
jgi:rhodanese-related sulfurtransferase